MKEKVPLPEEARVIFNDLVFIGEVLKSADGNVSDGLKEELENLFQCILKALWRSIYINTRFTKSDKLKLEVEGDDVFVVRTDFDPQNTPDLQ